MIITLNYIYKALKSKYRIELLSGSDSLNNPISWYFLAEETGDTEFLTGNEIVLSSCSNIQTHIDLTHFINRLMKQNCSAIILSTGKNVLTKDITDDIIKLCSQNNIALMTVPCTVNLALVMQDLNRLLLENAKHRDTLSLTFKYCLMSQNDSSIYLQTLRQYGFDNNGSYHVIVIHGLESDTMLLNILNTYFNKYHIFRYRQDHVIIIHDFDNNKLERMISDYTNRDYYNTLLASIGISDEITDLNNLSIAYNKASYAAVLAPLFDRKYIYFDDLSIYKIFFELKDSDMLSNVYTTLLAPIIEYDEKHNADYLPTLKWYLKTNKSVKDTAEKLGTHRNTINYRIRKIKQLLNNDLDNQNDNFNILLAFCIKDYLDLNY